MLSKEEISEVISYCQEQIENTIRPLALGRKNYLFCGNDASAGILKSKVAGHAPESDQDRTTCRQLDTT